MGTHFSPRPWFTKREQDHADWKNRAHFLGAAAQMMRRILVTTRACGGP